MHNFFEVLYLVKGDVTYNVESAKRKLYPGDVVVVAPGLYHFAEVNDDAPYERYTLKFQENLIPAPVVSRLRGKGAFFGDQRKFLPLFDGMETSYNSYSEEDLYYLFLCDTLRLLVMLSSEETSSTEQNGIIRQIVGYIDDHIYSPLSLESIASEFSFSKSYISNVFKKEMKIPIMQYVRNKKMIRAQQLILSGEKKSYVCQKLGFDNYSTFYRNYSSVIGGISTLST